jgi:hypothetical protein
MKTRKIDIEEQRPEKGLVDEGEEGNVAEGEGAIKVSHRRRLLHPQNRHTGFLPCCVSANG